MDLIKKDFIHTNYISKILFENYKKDKAEFYKISLKDNKLVTELVEKEDINIFNDKRYQINNIESKPHELYM